LLSPAGSSERSETNSCLAWPRLVLGWWSFMLVWYWWWNSLKMRD
jgi:hypothetical protein